MPKARRGDADRFIRGRRRSAAAAARAPDEPSGGGAGPSVSGKYRAGLACALGLAPAGGGAAAAAARGAFAWRLNLRAARPPARQIEPQAAHVLDAPGLSADWYRHALDWSSARHGRGGAGTIAVALSRSVYLWQRPGAVRALDVGGEAAALCFRADAFELAVAPLGAAVQIWDCAAPGAKLSRALRGSALGAAGAMAWGERCGLLVASAESGGCVHVDTRAPAPAARFRPRDPEPHARVCGLACNGAHLFAAGEAGGAVAVYDVRRAAGAGGELAPVGVCAAHRGTVKALAWQPCARAILATGGGLDDRRVRWWDVSANPGGEPAPLATVDAGRQVSGLAWTAPLAARAGGGRALVAALGFPRGAGDAAHALALWRWRGAAEPAPVPLGVANGHAARVLHLAPSPCGKFVASAAAGADETLRIWRVLRDADVAAGGEAAGGGGAGGGGGLLAPALDEWPVVQ